MRPFLFALLLIATSCSTVFTQRTYSLKVFSNGSDDKAEVDGRTYALPADIKVRRSKEDLHVRLHADSTTTDFWLEAIHHKKFTLGNLIWPPAYLIDLTNPKRFYYGDAITFDTRRTPPVIMPTPKDSLDRYIQKDFSAKKGQINLTFSIPYLNNFYLKPAGEPEKINTGFWGLSGGVEYYYTAKRFIALNGSVATDVFLPFPVAVDQEGYVETMRTGYLSATHNHQLKRFYVGYGLNFSRNVWSWYDDHATMEPPVPGIPPPPPDSDRKTSYALGFTLNGYHQFTERFMLGVIYRPTLLRVAPVTEFKYEHLISLDLAWRFVVREGRDK